MTRFWTIVTWLGVAMMLSALYARTGMDSVVLLIMFYSGAGLVFVAVLAWLARRAREPRRGP